MELFLENLFFDEEGFEMDRCVGELKRMWKGEFEAKMGLNYLKETARS